MSEPSFSWDAILEFAGPQHIAADHQRRRGSLEEVFAVGQGFQELNAELRQTSRILFENILHEFAGSHYDVVKKECQPSLVVRGAFDHAIGQRGQDCYLRSFFNFLTYDAVPALETHEAAAERLQSIMLEPGITRLSFRQKASLLDRVGTWAWFLVFAFFDHASGARKTPLITPEGFSMFQSHSQFGTPSREKALRIRCLARDHHRCVITRKFHDAEEIARVNANADATDDEGVRLRDIPDDGFSLLEVAHIIPHAMNAARSQTVELSAAQKLMRGVLDMLDPGILEGLNGADIDKPNNAISLAQREYSFFGALQIIFEPTDQWTGDHQEYHIRSIERNLRFTAVTRTLLEAEREEMPSRRYLEIHAAVAKICMMSGAGAYIDQLNREMEDGQIRADGGTDLGALVTMQMLDRTVEPIAAR